MIAEILATVLALLSAAAAVACLFERARTQSGESQVSARHAGVLDAIVESDPEVPISPSLLRTLVASAPADGVRIHLASVPGDGAADAAVAWARQCLPGLDARVWVGIPPARAVARTCLAGLALAGDRSDPCLLADARVIASSRDIAQILKAARGADLAMAAPVPTPGPVARTFLSPGAVAAAFAPLAQIALGPAGPLPGFCAVREGDRRAALADPLFPHRPSAGSALALRVAPTRTRLVPAAACIPDDRGSRDWVAGHLAFLVRLDRTRAFLLTALLAALPTVLCLCLAAPAGTPRGILLASLGVAFASRVATTLAWPASGPAPMAVAFDLALIPARDLFVTLLLFRAALSSRVRMGGVTFRAMKGGTLLPVAVRGDE